MGPADPSSARDPSSAASVAVASASASHDGPTLAECVSALSSSDAAIRANAADALLDAPAGPGAAPGERGAPWAYALVASDALVPLLSLVQAVRRDPAAGLAPVEGAPENTPEVVAAGDAALLVLAELADVASAILADAGWRLARDDATDRPAFVDERSGMAQSAPPLDLLNLDPEDWIAPVLLECPSLVNPIGVCPATRLPRWPVRVLRHVPASARRAPEHTSVTVLDLAVEEGEEGDRTRALVRGAWRGSNGDVEGEADPAEPAGAALDAWTDACAVAACVVRAASRENETRIGPLLKREGATRSNDDEDDRGDGARRSKPDRGSETMASAHPSARIPRVAVLGLRCGASASFLASRRLASADVLEPDAEVVRAGRDFFRLDFDEIDWDEVKDDPTRVEALVASAPAPGRFRVWTGCRDPGAFFNAAKRVWERTKRETTEDQSLFAGAIGDLPDAADHRPAALLRGLVRSGAVGIAALAARDSAAAARGVRAFLRGDGEGDGDGDGGAGVDVVVACDPDEEDLHLRGGEAVDEFAGLRGRGGVVLAGRSGAGDSDPSTPLLGALLDPSTANPALAALRLPFEVETWAPARGPGSRVRMASFRAADEDEEGAPRLVDERKDAANDAWGVFGDEATETDAYPRSASAADATNRVFTAATAATIGGDTTEAKPNAKRKRPRDARAFWTEALGGLACDGGEQGPRDEKKDDAGKKKEAEEDLAGFEVGGGGAADAPTESEAARVAESVRAAGYVAGTRPAVPASEAAALARAIAALGERGWPPACVFMSDLAWRAVDRLWPHAEAALGGRSSDERSGSSSDEVLLEPSLAAFALKPPDAPGRRGGGKRRYVGNNFGAPHRDYETRAVFPGGRPGGEHPRVLSAWVPLVDVTMTNGCVYVVPRGAARGGRDEEGETNGRTDEGGTDERTKTDEDSDEDDANGGGGGSRAPSLAFDRAAATPLAPLRAGSFSAWAGDVVHWGTACEGGPRGETPRASLAFVFRRADAPCDARGEALRRGEVRAGAGLSLRRRAALVAHALTCFEHWYGETGAKRREIAETVEGGGGEEGEEESEARRRG